jgi:dolichol-phosphate mannosyltransferase
MIPKFWEALSEHDLVVGTRFAEGSVFESSFYRRFISWGCIILAKGAGTKLSDPMSGFFGIQKDILKKVKFKPITWKTCLEIELKAKPSIMEIPITFVERTVGKSKTTTKVGLKIIKELF